MKNIDCVKVAAVQMICGPGEVEENLVHAEQLVGQAVNRGAELVLLPELMPSGYLATEKIWDYAEPIDGLSVTWLLETASHFGIYLGFSFLEIEDEDFYNTFVLASPSGKLLGRVRKNPPASIEAYFYKAGNDYHVIETDIGRIGVSICYELLLHEHMCFLYDERIDLLIAPAAIGRPKTRVPGDVRRLEKSIKRVCSIAAKVLGVPVILANRVGALETELPGNLPYVKSVFLGLSSIRDSNGVELDSLQTEEGVIVADVAIGMKEQSAKAPKKYGKIWSAPMPWFSYHWPLTQKKGEQSYQANARRKARALLFSTTKADSSV